jgi:hypothetical protein
MGGINMAAKISSFPISFRIDVFQSPLLFPAFFLAFAALYLLYISNP